MITESQFQVAANRVVDRCAEIARISEVEFQTTRTFCCPAMKNVHSLISQWMLRASLSPRIDAAANLIGQRDNERPQLLIGSHLDTVVNAGKYDGVLGVLLGLAAAELICENAIVLPFDVCVVGFSEEEGVRFNRPYIGSSAIAGCFDAQVLELVDSDGYSVRTALSQFGCQGEQWAAATFANQNVIGFIEPHIEQGPVLQSKKQSVGVVSAIAGQTRATISLTGTAGHAGTVPHELRHDALAAAAEIVLMIESIGNETAGLVATVGKIDVHPNASNVIPGSVTMTLDLRHADDKVRQTSFEKICQSIDVTAGRRQVASTTKVNLDQPAVPMDEKLNEALSGAISQLGFTPQTLLSGAGHDAAIMAQLAPTAMLFIRCRDGISHHPDEHVELEDVVEALKVLMKSLGLIGSR